MVPHLRSIVLSSCVLVALPAFAGGGWYEAARMERLRQEVAATVHEGLIYVVGGFEGTAPSTIEAYDPEIDHWWIVTELPGALHHTAAVSMSDGIYIVGGYTDEAFTPTDSVRRFDPDTLQFESLAPMPTPTGAHTAASIDGKIYVAGGRPVLRRLLIYDPDTNTWSEGPPMPSAREHLASAVFDGKLWVVGGRVRFGSGESDALESFDPSTNMWTIHPPMPTPRGGLAASFVNGRLYVFGGEGNPDNPNGTFPQNESFDPSTKAWSTEPPMPIPVHGMVAVTLGDRIYIPAGGPIEGFSATDRTQVFVPSGTERRRGARR